MEWFTIIVSVLIGAIGIQLLLWRKPNKLKKMGVLHPTAWPIIGNSGSVVCFRSHFTDMIESIYRFNEEADYVGFYDLRDPMILIRSPELLKNIAVKHFDHFTDHRNFFDLDSESLFSKNLFALRGEKWKEVRTLLSPAFTGSKMKNMFELMSTCGNNFVEHLVNVSLDKSNIVNSKDIFTRFSNDVIATCAFGINIDSMKYPSNEFYMLGKDATNFSALRGLKLVLVRMFPLLKKLLGGTFVSPKVESFFENIIRETIETREKQGITRPDMLQLMMESHEKKPDKSRDFTIRDMTAQAFVFFFGGFESVATVMCLVAHEIALASEVQNKLQREIDEVLAERTSQKCATYEVINGMQYLDAVVNETLRLYPINLFLERVCTKSFELPPALPGSKPVTIEPGQSVWYPTFSVQRDPKYYPNPKIFDPERFMGDAKSKIDPLTYLPFGMGPRMCIANRFALLEVKVLIFNLLAKCSLKSRPGARSPIELKKTGFNFVPREGFWLEIEPRKAPVR
ncbi:cytochrome P450 9e2-like [Venturia canescens]|uniref:cytochrome P450 9e2-like n=1 Tax=Venturia canescens TaxID=32260 RepID=UPI001C9CB874|nr:cytochrome P450 9e2-like [Venturia canescens]